MIITSQSANAVGCISGAWKIWSLSDGHIDLPSDLLKVPDGGVYKASRSIREASFLRLSVNCFLIDRSGADRVLIDCGAGGSWDASLGHLEEAMVEAGIDPSSVSVVALTHTHLDHVNGLLTPDGREMFANLTRIVIAEDAVQSFFDEQQLTRFRHLLAPIRSGGRLVDHLSAVAMPGHAPGHMGYLLNTGDENILFCGDMIHVPAAQFAQPELTWGYDDSQAVARATRIKALQEAAGARTWLAGPHLGRPGIGKVVEDGQGYAFVPVA